MLMVRYVAGALALFSSLPVMAQQAQLPLAPLGPQSSVLTVSAQGESRRVPDLAIFQAGVVTQGRNAAEASAENARKMEQVLAALKRAGIKDRDLQTSQLSLNPRFSDPERDALIQARANRTEYVPPAIPPQPEIIGYEARNSVQVRVRDVSKMGTVVDALVAAGANEVNGPTFTLDSQEEALDEARVAAMAMAQRRADLYAKAAGLRVVRILSISEGGGYYQPVTGFADRIVLTAASKGGMAPSAPPPPVQAGEMALNTNVTVQYELAR